MTAPFIFSQNMSLFIAVVLGIFFGFFLERGGLGSPHKLTGVFYLRDFTVPKVMFTAIIVAASGLYLLADLSLIEIERVWLVPTFFWPQLVGGTIFGIGFFMSGYCPGTAMAGLASGRIDALVTLSGIVVGSFIFAFFYPILEDFYGSSAMGIVTLQGLLGTSHWVVIGLLTVFAGVMFYLMERFGKKN